jgi:hypothetical protein
MLRDPMREFSTASGCKSGAPFTVGRNPSLAHFSYTLPSEKIMGLLAIEPSSNSSRRAS